MAGHLGRVGSLAWNQWTLSSGSRDSSIHISDVRIAEHHVSSLNGHKLEVCGLKWCVEGQQLASGGNDNLLNIWDVRKTKPRFTIDDHQVRLILLAPSGVHHMEGNSTDGWFHRQELRHWHGHHSRGTCSCQGEAHVMAESDFGMTTCLLISTDGGLPRNSSSGSCLNTIDTKSQVAGRQQKWIHSFGLLSQVCALMWSQQDRELVSSHGFSSQHASNQLVLWKHPTMCKLAELSGHSSRVTTSFSMKSVTKMSYVWIRCCIWLNHLMAQQSSVHLLTRR